jgi:hypothetical protein
MVESPRGFECAAPNYLQVRLHTQRGLSVAEYRARCQELWDACPVDKQCAYRLLINEQSDAGAAGGYGYDDERIKEVLDSEDWFERHLERECKAHHHQLDEQ